MKKKTQKILGLSEERKEEILKEVGKVLDYQFETYTWDNMIDDADLPRFGFTNLEIAWAKRNICYYGVYSLK